MSTLIDLLEPGESVVWRSRRVWRPLSDSSLLLIPVDIVLLPLVFLAGMVLSASGRRIPARQETMLTDRRLLFRAGLCPPVFSGFDRADIAALEVFAGDDTVVVHGRAGTLHRATVPGEAVNLAQAAGVTTALWRSRLPLQARTHLAMRSFFALIFGVGALVLSLLAVVFHPTLLDDAQAWIPNAWGEKEITAAGAGVALIAFLSGGLAGYLFGSMLAHKSVGGEDLCALRCWKLHPLWQGRVPPGRFQSSLARPGQAIRAALDRLFWGPLSDCAAIEAEIIAPNDWDSVGVAEWQHPIDPHTLR